MQPGLVRTDVHWLKSSGRWPSFFRLGSSSASSLNLPLFRT